MAYIIDKNVPLPEDKRKREPKYPFGNMEIGDSFYAETSAANLGSRGAAFAKKNPGFRFKTASEGEGARIWRIEPKAVDPLSGI